jgi:hypothetical protein
MIGSEEKTVIRGSSARSVIVPGGLLNSSMTACSGVGEPIARTLPDSLSPTTAGLDDARVALSLQQEHFERVRRLPRFARKAITAVTAVIGSESAVDHRDARLVCRRLRGWRAGVQNRALPMCKSHQGWFRSRRRAMGGWWPRAECLR